GAILGPRRDARGRDRRPGGGPAAGCGGQRARPPPTRAGRDRARSGRGDRNERRRARPAQSAVRRTRGVARAAAVGGCRGARIRRRAASSRRAARLSRGGTVGVTGGLWLWRGATTGARWPPP